jgi:hypothetical protein
MLNPATAYVAAPRSPPASASSVKTIPTGRWLATTPAAAAAAAAARLAFFPAFPRLGVEP